MRKYIAIVILALLPFAAYTQIWKGAGIVWVKTAPSHNPGATGSWVAIDTLSGSWYEWETASNSWKQMGDRVQFTGAYGVPGYTPGKQKSFLAVNLGDSLYAYQGGSWTLLNPGAGASYNSAMTFASDTLSLTDGGGTLKARIPVTTAYNSSLTYANDSLILVDGNSTLKVKLPQPVYPANLSLFATSTPDTVVNYVKLVTNPSDPDYDSIAVNISTGTIVNTDQLVASLVSKSGLIEGNPGIITVQTIGQIRRVSGTGVASFYFTVLKRDSLGAETLLATSDKTAAVTNSAYQEFQASALLNNGSWLASDRIVVKFYGDRVAGGSDPTYGFQFGGSNPVRTLFPVPASILVNVPIKIGTTEVQGGTSTYLLATDANGILTEVDPSTIGGGGGLSGGVSDYLVQWTGATSVDTSGIIWTGGNLGIQETSPIATVNIKGAGADSTTTALLVESSTDRAMLAIKNSGSVELARNTSVTIDSVATVTVVGSATNIGISLQPQGSGFISAQIPTGTSDGGNKRGAKSVDFQMSRANASEVASGARSVVVGGISNSAKAIESAVLGGADNEAVGFRSGIVSGVSNETAANATSAFIGGGEFNTANNFASSIAGGQSNVASADYAAISGGARNQITGQFGAIPGGEYARAPMYGQHSIAAGRFAGTGDAQTSSIRYRRAITGESQTELFLDGTNDIATLELPTGAANGRLWNAKVQVTAIVTSAGTADTIVAGSSFIGEYMVGVKRIGTSTVLTGGGITSAEESADAGMQDSFVAIEPDDTNESLRIQFTPPSDAESNTVIRVMATVYLTEVGY